MTLAPRARKLALGAHLVASVGWLGAVVAFLALALVGWLSDDALRVRGAYLAMEAIGWLVLVPLALASLLTGLVQSLGTAWGLLRHYWVVFKLAINLVATVVLLLYMQTLGTLADAGSGAALAGAGHGGLRSVSPVLHAAGALLLLLTAVTLGVVKPRGLTPYGQRKEAERRPAGSRRSRPS